MGKHSGKHDQATDDIGANAGEKELPISEGPPGRHEKKDDGEQTDDQDVVELS